MTDPSVKIALAMLLTAFMMLIPCIMHYSYLLALSAAKLHRAKGWASRERRLELEAVERAAKNKRQPIGYTR